jgi:beta-N-acetylhexosaminidase
MQMRRATPWLAGLACAAALGAAAAIPAGAAERTDLSTLDRQQLAGQRAIYSYTGPNPPPRLLELIRRGRVGGVIFFGENITSKSQIRGVVNRLQAAQRQSPIKEPLLVMTDQEGGLVRRVPGAPVLSEADIGASGQVTEFGTQAGRNGGINIRGAGINVDLAPVLGVFRQPGDFLDQFQRSYSMDPGVVGAAGSAFVAAQQRTGVATTIKHFPGLGAAEANEDTDLVPVTIDLPLETLRTVDLAPYPAGINAGARLVLSSWATYPALDPRPAGLSRQWMQGELRERLRFRGVTITDAMEAGALEPFGPTRRRAVLAADAGQDLLLFSSRSLAQGIEGRQSVARALGNGTIERKSFFTSLNRVMKLRADLADRPNGPLPAPG